jgi:drug/metabolite transporter (DMT)-like permease
VDLTALLLAVTTMFFWGLTWVLMKAGVDRMSGLALGVLRPWMGLPLIGLYALLAGNIVFVSLPLAGLAFLTGSVNAFLGTALFYYALRRGSLHETNILANTNPFWGVVSAILILGEPPTLVTPLAGLLVIGGTYFLVRRRGAEAGVPSLKARTAALLTGVVWGFSAAVPTKYCMTEGMSPIAFQLLFTAGAAISWGIAALPRRRELRVTGRGLWIAFLSSFFGMFAGWVLWLLALERASASALSPLVGLILVFATALGVIFLKERLTKRVLIGGALVLAGVTLVSLFGR